MFISAVVEFNRHCKHEITAEIATLGPLLGTDTFYAECIVDGPKKLRGTGCHDEEV